MKSDIIFDVAAEHIIHAYKKLQVYRDCANYLEGRKTTKY